VRRDPDLQRFYRRKMMQKGFAKARVAAARKLGIRLWIIVARIRSTTQSSAAVGWRGSRERGVRAGMPVSALVLVRE